MSSLSVLHSGRTIWIKLESLCWRSVCVHCRRRLYTTSVSCKRLQTRLGRFLLPAVATPLPLDSISVGGLTAKSDENGRAKNANNEETTSETDQGFEKENILTIPNVLSLARILVTPVLGHQVLQSHYLTAFGLLAVAAISDVVDGQIARHYPSQSSMLGSVLDPLADKCLVSVLCITLTIQNLIPLPLTVVILSRDVLLIAASLYIRYKTLPPPRTWSRYWDIQRSTLQVTPTLLSKANTLLQLSTVGLSLGAALINASHHPLLQALWAVTAVSTVTSGASYLIQMKGYRILKKNNNRHPPS